MVWTTCLVARHATSRPTARRHRRPGRPKPAQLAGSSSPPALLMVQAQMVAAPMAQVQVVVACLEQAPGSPVALPPLQQVRSLSFPPETAARHLALAPHSV